MFNRIMRFVECWNNSKIIVADRPPKKTNKLFEVHFLIGSKRGPFNIDATMRALNYSYGEAKLHQQLDDLCIGNNLLLDRANVWRVDDARDPADTPHVPRFGIYHVGKQGYWREEGLFSRIEPFQSWVDADKATTFDSRDQAQRAVRNIRALLNDYCSTMEIDLLYPSPNQREDHFVRED